MAKIQYLSAHSILEFDEVKLFVELGHEVFANGAYLNPEGHYALPRPGIPGAKFYPEYLELATHSSRTHLPPELIEPFDIIIATHLPEFLTEQWDMIKHKTIIWRSIGQSLPWVENALRRFHYEGMKIVRMSPMEKNIIGYMGEDAMIRFYKDPEEWKDWNGQDKTVINFTQSLKGRRMHCHYDEITQIMNGFPSMIYGTGNEDLGGLNGGSLAYELMQKKLRDSRVFVYGGTWPSPYTLALQEAMMTGIPVVAIGKKLAEEIPMIPHSDRQVFYELPDIIRSGENGFISDDINELRGYVAQLLEDEQLAQRISKEGRKTAIRLWGKEKIKKEWEDFLNSI